MPRTARDDFYVLMWNYIDPLFIEGPQKADRAIARFRELGCNGGTVMATFVDVDDYKQSLKLLGYPEITFRTMDVSEYRYRENSFPFFVMNMCRPLYMKWEEGKPLFRSQYEAFERERNRHVFVRQPCVNDPAVMGEMKRRIGRIMEGLSSMRDLCLLYDLRDEPSITSFLLASDSCFCTNCLSNMREWLREQYGSLAALNTTWGTQFASWEEVEPITTQEAIERRESGNWNFAAWHDHRAFMNTTFARVCNELKEVVKRHDPEGLVGLCGTQCPSVFGGFDMSLLVPVLDWAEPYAYANSLDCFRSFKPRRHMPLLKTTGLGGGTAVSKV
ncbi:MAG: beta-galactosidase, partial [Kiritimatiellae bacterium]|nr:beta-galactosidase [Kiritimatiellia bacterium]